MPLTLTSREQSALAELCSLLRGWLYQEQIGRPMAAEELRDRIADLAGRFELTPQQFDGLYDRLHRSGANVR